MRAHPGEGQGVSAVVHRGEGRLRHEPHDRGSPGAAGPWPCSARWTFRGALATERRSGCADHGDCRSLRDDLPGDRRGHLAGSELGRRRAVRSIRLAGLHRGCDALRVDEGQTRSLLPRLPLHCGPRARNGRPGGSEVPRPGRLRGREFGAGQSPQGRLRPQEDVQGPARGPGDAAADHLREGDHGEGRQPVPRSLLQVLQGRAVHLLPSGGSSRR
mmetsp:Transcript_125253/g.312952  ORF Transcript_125253/g.312952 Transcript_125253/m.312952 type:complete len:216 (+) Transcript_125253:383-1030(+)